MTHSLSSDRFFFLKYFLINFPNICLNCRRKWVRYGTNGWTVWFGFRHWFGNEGPPPPPEPRLASYTNIRGFSLQFEDKAELEWLSDFVAGPFDAGIMNLDDIKESQFRTPSPVSVLESSSCSSKAIPLCLETNFPGRARTKRPRPTSFSGRSIPLVLPSSSENDPAPPDSDPITAFQPKFENFIESQLPKKIRKQKKKKLSEDQLYVRKCLHCEIQKTPQWRTGPMGPKTLCNACGVRYKSGRLYPEYRPAASPTFVPSKHSNSHKKVVEMRIKSGKKNSETELVPGFSLPGSEFLLQNSDSMMDYL